MKEWNGWRFKERKGEEEKERKEGRGMKKRKDGRGIKERKGETWR